jgi:LuxR family maltose regulon positive regulatory protein
VLRGDGVSRERLLSLLERSTSTKLVLVHAPAGYGKTTLMVQWFKHLEGAGQGVGWIDIDEHDNDSANLLRSLQLALLPNGPADSLDVLELINRCAESHRRFTLFLDEIEALQGPASLQLLELLLEYSPANLHIVAGARTPPALPLARLRIRDQLVEIDSRDLRFARAEAAQFLYVRSGAQLSKPALDGLLDKTEGWAAALQLAALSLARGADGIDVMDHLSGTRAQVVEYLAADVLASLSDHVRRFLLETSVLRRLCAPLCDAVTEGGDSAALLLKVETANLFLQPLDHTRGWYRYHALFAEFLRAQLQHQAPERAVAVARKAADWCAENGLLIESVEYSLQAGDTDSALPRMEQCIDEQVSHGQFRTVAQWVAAVPPAVLDQHPRLVIAKAWAQTFSKDYALMDDVLAQLRRVTQDPHTSQAYRVALLALEPILLVQAGKLAQAIERSEAAWPQTDASFALERGSLADNLAYGSIAAGRHEAAQKYLREAIACHTAPRPSVLGLAYTAGISAMAEACIGNLDGAIHAFRSMEKLVAERGRSVAPHLEPGFMPALYMGNCAELLYEQNQIDATEEWLDRHLRFIESIPSISSIVLAWLTRARMSRARDDRAGAEEALASAAQHAVRGRISRLLPAVEWERVRIALVSGDVERARVMAQSLTADSTAHPEVPLIEPDQEVNGAGIEIIRLQIHTGQANLALSALEPQLKHARSTLRRRRLLKLCVLQALAWEALQQRSPALQSMTEAVKCGAAMRAIRSFVDEGAAARHLLQALADDGGLRRDRKLAAHLKQVLEAFPPSEADGDDVPSSAAEASSQALSDREMAILQRLAQGYTNLAVAQQLFVSTNTVKWHLRHIYTKLGAKNRSEAVFMARQQRLIG